MQAQKVPTWFLHDDWDIKSLSSSTRKKIKYAKKRFSYCEAKDDDIKMLSKLLYEWSVIAKRRHFIVNKGAYEVMLNNHLMFKNSHLYTIKYIESGEICGFFGGYSENAGLQQFIISQAKHNYQHNYAGEALWTFFIETFIDGKYKLANCGDTANIIKQKMGLKRLDSYKTSNMDITQLFSSKKDKQSFGEWFNA